MCRSFWNTLKGKILIAASASGCLVLCCLAPGVLFIGSFCKSRDIPRTFDILEQLKIIEEAIGPASSEF